MTLLFRRVAVSKPWQQMISAKADETVAADPPLWALRDFTPEERDKGGISVFEVEDGEDVNEAIEAIAGAFAFHDACPPDNGRFVFVGAERKALEQSELSIKDSPGGLLHSFADKRHREILVQSLPELVAVTKVFLSSKEFISVEGKIAGKAARASAQKDEFNFLPLYKTWTNSSGGKNLVKFVSESIVFVSGRAGRG